MTILSLDISFVVRELTFEVGEQKSFQPKESGNFCCFFVPQRSALSKQEVSESLLVYFPFLLEAEALTVAALERTQRKPM